MNDFLLSIIVPVYNTKEYINQCLTSILDQNCKNIQLIIIDDGSTDGSGEMCDRFKSLNPDIITVIHKANGGLSDARNTGMKYAAGEYIWFVDSDDYMEKDCIKSIIPFLDTKADIYEMGYIIHGGKEFKQVMLPISGDKQMKPDTYIYNSLKACNYTWQSWKYIIKKEYYVDNNYSFISNRNYEDIILMPELILKAKGIQPVCLVAYHYRLFRDGSITNSCTLKNDKDSIMAVSDAIKKIQFVKDTELRKLLLDRISKVYYHSLDDLYKLQKKAEKKELEELLKQNRNIMKYTKSGKQVITKICITLFGFKITSALIHIRLRILARYKYN